jgi:hypothetical protein
VLYTRFLQILDLSRGLCHLPNCSREFITLIACVCALSNAIPPTLLYKGKSRDLQDTWVDELEDVDDMFFGATENGWTNDAYGLK